MPLTWPRAPPNIDLALLIEPKTVLGDGDDNAAGAPSHEVATLLLQCNTPLSVTLFK
jgi:hypothetical protein